MDRSGNPCCFNLFVINLWCSPLANSLRATSLSQKLSYPTHSSPSWIWFVKRWLDISTFLLRNKLCSFMHERITEDHRCNKNTTGCQKIHQHCVNLKMYMKLRLLPFPPISRISCLHSSVCWWCWKKYYCSIAYWRHYVFCWWWSSIQGQYISSKG